VIGAVSFLVVSTLEMLSVGLRGHLLRTEIYSLHGFSHIFSSIELASLILVVSVFGWALQSSTTLRTLPATGMLNRSLHAPCRPRWSRVGSADRSVGYRCQAAFPERPRRPRPPRRALHGDFSGCTRRQVRMRTCAWNQVRKGHLMVKVKLANRLDRNSLPFFSGRG